MRVVRGFPGLGEGAVVPEVAFVGEAGSYEAWGAVQGVEGEGV